MENEQEIWKDIDGYDGFYQISSAQKIRSLDRVITCFDPRWEKPKIVPYKGRELKFIVDSDGYYQVSLCKRGTQTEKKVHRLMALAFIDNVDGKPVINHKNGIKTDNRIENLEWCTVEENNIHALNNGLLRPLKGDKHHAFNKKGKDHYLSKVIIDLQTGIFYFGAREAALAKGLNHNTLRGQLRGTYPHKTSLRYA